MICCSLRLNIFFQSSSLKLNPGTDPLVLDEASSTAVFCLQLRPPAHTLKSVKMDLHLQFLLWYILACSSRVMSDIRYKKKIKYLFKNTYYLFSWSFFSSVRRGSGEWTILLLPDFVAIGHFHLNLFFPTWEDLDTHIFVMWKSIENLVFLWTYCSSQTTLLKWIAVLCHVICYFIYLPSSLTSEENFKVLTESESHVSWQKKKCKSSLFTRMCLYEHEDQCAMFKAKHGLSMPMEYQSILLVMLTEVAQRLKRNARAGFQYISLENPCLF